MWNYEKRLQFPVKISKPDPKAAQIIITQFGGPDVYALSVPTVHHALQGSHRNSDRYRNRRIRTESLLPLFVFLCLFPSKYVAFLFFYFSIL